MYGDDALGSLSPERHPVADEDRAVRWRRNGQEFFLLWAHGWQSCQTMCLVKGGQGSHRAFGRAGEPDLLNFQNRDGYIPPYQGRQLIQMMEKYGGKDDEVSD